MKKFFFAMLVMFSFNAVVNAASIKVDTSYCQASSRMAEIFMERIHDGYLTGEDYKTYPLKGAMLETQKLMRDELKRVTDPNYKTYVRENYVGIQILLNNFDKFNERVQAAFAKGGDVKDSLDLVSAQVAILDCPLNKTITYNP